MNEEALIELVKSDIDNLFAKYVRLMNDFKIEVQYVDKDSHTHVFEAELNKNVTVK